MIHFECSISVNSIHRWLWLNEISSNRNAITNLQTIHYCNCDSDNNNIKLENALWRKDQFLGTLKRPIEEWLHVITTCIYMSLWVNFPLGCFELKRASEHRDMPSVDSSYYITMTSVSHRTRYTYSYFFHKYTIANLFPYLVYHNLLG